MPASRGIFCGGTEMTPQFHRFAREELVPGIDFVPTYGNTLMGLACPKPFDPADGYAITYYPPLPRAVFELVDPDDAERAGRLRRDRPGDADDADPRVLHAALPRARRGRARRARPSSTPGTASPTCACFARLADSVVVGVY